MQIIPQGNCILLESRKADIGSIVLPGQAANSKDFNVYIVRAKGEGRLVDGVLVPITLQIGDEVIIPNVMELNAQLYGAGLCLANADHVAAVVKERGVNNLGNYRDKVAVPELVH